MDALNTESLASHADIVRLDPSGVPYQRHDVRPFQGVYTPARAETLSLIRDLNVARRCTLLTSSNYMNPEAAKLGVALNDLLSGGSSRIYRSFFVNSSIEALSGAIKLARQTSVRKGKADQGWVLVVDSKERFQTFLDPCGRGEHEAATPHVRFVQSVEAAFEAAGTQEWSGMVVVREPNTREPRLQQLAALAHARGALWIECRSELPPSEPALLAPAEEADVVVFGENLGDRQLPFGCFCMTSEAHEVWNNDTDCFAQTSTFGGNLVSTASALLAIRRHGHLPERLERTLAGMDADFALALARWGQHVNPGMAKLAPIFGMDMRVVEARGARLVVEEAGRRRELLDCSSGFGSNLRGHNPEDVPELLARHDPEHDYFAELERLLCSLTGFDRAFPAVSGATAVDLAVSLALLANRERRKVVTFTGNFSGKTLFSLNLSKHGPQLTESDPEAFRPYYAELVYVDPFAKDAKEQLRSVLRKGDVALVWFEVIRGGMCEHLPQELLQLIDEMKAEQGYLIGVDEVLTAGWRTGDSYLAHAGRVRKSDIVTVGKHLSDMTTPMAAVLARDGVVERARATNPAHVERLRVHHRNHLTAHIALNAVEQAASDARRREGLRAHAIIEAGLRKLVSDSKLFASVEGQGAMLLLTMNKKYFPFHHRSKPGNLLEMALAHLIYERASVFVFLLRFLHRTCATEQDARELIQRLDQGLKGVTPGMIYRYALSRVLSQPLPRFSRWLAGRVAQRPAGYAP